MLSTILQIAPEKPSIGTRRRATLTSPWRIPQNPTTILKDPPRHLIVPQRCHIQRVTFKNASKSLKIHKKNPSSRSRIPQNPSKNLQDTWLCHSVAIFNESLSKSQKNPPRSLKDPFKMLRGTSLVTKLRYFNQNLTEKLQIAAALPHFNRSSKDCNHPAGILPEFAGILPESWQKERANSRNGWIIDVDVVRPQLGQIENRIWIE